MGAKSRSTIESELEDDRSSRRRRWGSGSVPGSLSDKYGNSDTFDVNLGPSRRGNKELMDDRGHGINTENTADDGDGIMTTISSQVEPFSEDRCSSIISLSDKYRTQEEVEVFQVIIDSILFVVFALITASLY